MNTFVVLATVLAAASASVVNIQKVGYGPTTLQRAPAHDSASIESHRLGGNFAYATAEAHAYAHVTPEISEATFPVAETTHVHQAPAIAHVQPAPIVKTHHAHRPILGQEPVYGTHPVIGPVATRTHIQQQLIKQKHVSYHQPTATIVKQPVADVHAVEHAVPAVAVAPAAVAVKGYAAGPAIAAGYGAAPAIAAGYGAAPAIAAGYGAAPVLAGGYGAAPGILGKALLAKTH